ncbi:PREDICTED: retinol dehydrogenase 13 isoform X1 [Sturnus vulgaris]|uniref:retinol dehydrogenase 13 isoform X1 n=1 Tax=Sturnus vulgaris TaxID=9172 RepID=UPI00071A97DC|nr:PREDICTED: retinol dehydrogenase 13 isoform X1 [Sturnus vulgaris]
MELLGTLSPPWWLLLLLLLALLLWATHRSPWEPRKCPADLTGKTVIVTGANSGIGKCVAMDLARRNARTILACRSRERGQAAVEEIRAATGNPAVVLRLLDTGSLASVRAFASAVLREESRLDVLVNNAGVTGLPFTITSEGLEQTFAINYLGPFLLTNLLLDLLKASAPARVVNVSSLRHSVGTADSGFLTGQRRPGGYDAAYSSTKLMNVLFTAELARRLQGTVGRAGRCQHHLLRRLGGSCGHHREIFRQQLPAGAALGGRPRCRAGTETLGGIGAADGAHGAGLSHRDVTPQQGGKGDTDAALLPLYPPCAAVRTTRRRPDVTATLLLKTPAPHTPLFPGDVQVQALLPHGLQEAVVVAPVDVGAAGQVQAPQGPVGAQQ